MSKTLKIGTRTSQLALYQTHLVVRQLQAQHPDLAIEIVEITTSGDWKKEQGETRLSEAEGGKGLFAKEIEEAILGGVVDCGVHSMKDMASFLPEGLVIKHILPREDARDAFLANDYDSVMDLPANATVGTASLRRQAFILAKRPDLNVVPFRGNVPTRIEKLRSGQVDATILAVSGLKRLELEHEITAILETGEMLPAAGQGAIGIETRSDDIEVQNFFEPLHCYESGVRVAAERAALATLDGSCRTPIGAHAVFVRDDVLALRVTVAAPDGSKAFTEERATEMTSVQEASALGVRIGEALKAELPSGFLEW